MRRTMGCLFVFVVGLACEAAAQPPVYPAIRIDSYGIQPQTFVLTGAAYGASTVHVWAFQEGVDPIFLGAATPNQVDAPRQRETGGFSLLVRNLPIGLYQIVAYAHDALPAPLIPFPTWAIRSFSIYQCNYEIVRYDFHMVRQPPFTYPDGTDIRHIDSLVCK